MELIINRDAFIHWNVTFEYSPLFEMICSLHVLFSPEHHRMRLDWATSLKDEMDVELYNGLELFDKISHGWMSVLDFLDLYPELNDHSVVKSLTEFEEIDVDIFTEILFENKLEPVDIKKIRVLNKIHLENLDSESRMYLLNMEMYKKRLFILLNRYYSEHFKYIQEETQPYLIRALEAHKSLSEMMPFLDYIRLLHPRIEVGENIVHFHKYKRFDMPFKDIKIVRIRISSFIDPHLLVGLNEGKMQLTIRAKIKKVENDVHDDLFNTLKALADKTRLRILKHLFRHPCSTQELAIQLEMSEAAVSKHLKKMMGAGLLSKIRHGNYVLYYLDRIEIDRLPMNMYQYLDE